MKKYQQVVLIIRDGWGIGAPSKWNAVANASTPNMKSYLAKYPNTILEAAGTYVGLPDGYQGSSEVGHLNMGAGRIVKQELARINDALVDGTFFSNANYQKALKNCVENGKAMHLMGLVQDEGVHAHQEHLFALMKKAKEGGVKNLYIHFFSDGRDTAPRSSLSFLFALNEKIKEYGIGKIGTLMGRYYGMDRGKKWNLIDLAYDSMVNAEGRKVATAEEAIKTSYEKDRTPDHEEMFDEYIPPTIIGDYPGIKEGDSVIHFNYRQDRAIELTRAFIDADYPGKRKNWVKVVYCGLTKYYDSFDLNILGSMDDEGGMGNLLGEVISNSGLKQLRIAETQKFKHVTSFFNGKLTTPNKEEKQVEIKGSFDPALFAEHPEMNAHDVTDALLKEMKETPYPFIAVNFANCDMVGHTGNYEAAKKAVEVTDECVGKVVAAVLASDGVALITADHGNAEEMFDEKSGLAKTSHTKNPVECIFVANDTSGVELRKRGILADIAPTILALLGIEKPKEMTAENLVL